MRAHRKYSGHICFTERLTKHGNIIFTGLILFLCCQNYGVWAQSGAGQTAVLETPEEKVEQLTAAVAQAQIQMEAYQKQLLDLRQQLAALQQQMKSGGAPSAAATDTATSNASDTTAAATMSAAVEELRERQTIAESQIATLDTIKVETQSKYPLKVSGLLLFNSFVNTRQVDISASPAYALSGPGSTGLSLRQTVLGLDARGPHLLGATSVADLRVDFFANNTQSNYAASGVVRLRTAHAALDWPNTQAFIELDRTILQPNEPSSLVSVAQPELAWAGNLWNWIPQIGMSHQFAFSDSSRIKAQAALIDTSDPLRAGNNFDLPNNADRAKPLARHGGTHCVPTRRGQHWTGDWRRRLFSVLIVTRTATLSTRGRQRWIYGCRLPDILK